MAQELFVPTQIEADSDLERTCGTCLKRKTLDQFYKDGTDSDGLLKYRRDCKECYRVNRLKNQRKKKQAEDPKTRPTGKNRRRKK